MTGNKHIQISVAIHISGACIVGTLVCINKVPQEVSFAIILIPRGNTVFVATASADIYIAILVEVFNE